MVPAAAIARATRSIISVMVLPRNIVQLGRNRPVVDLDLAQKRFCRLRINPERDIQDAHPEIIASGADLLDFFQRIDHFSPFSPSMILSNPGLWHNSISSTSRQKCSTTGSVVPMNAGNSYSGLEYFSQPISCNGTCISSDAPIARQ